MVTFRARARRSTVVTVGLRMPRSILLIAVKGWTLDSKARSSWDQPRALRRWARFVARARRAGESSTCSMLEF